MRELSWVENPGHVSSKPRARPRSGLRLRRLASTNSETRIKPTLRSVVTSKRQQAFALTAWADSLARDPALDHSGLTRPRALQVTALRRCQRVAAAAELGRLVSASVPPHVGAARYAASEMGSTSLATAG